MEWQKLQQHGIGLRGRRKEKEGGSGEGREGGREREKSEGLRFGHAHEEDISLRATEGLGASCESKLIRIKGLAWQVLLRGPPPPPLLPLLPADLPT